MIISEGVQVKRTIRRFAFETNSSTMHSCVIMTADQYKRWEEEYLYYYPCTCYRFRKLPDDKKPVCGMLYTQAEVLGFYKLIGYEYNPDELDYEPDEYDTEKELIDKYIAEMGDFYEYNAWHNDELEYDDHTFRTPGGEDIVVECKYGYD